MDRHGSQKKKILVVTVLAAAVVLLALTEDHGGNTVIRAHPDRLLLVEVPEEELTDVDTPQALSGLEEQTHT